MLDKIYSIIFIFAFCTFCNSALIRSNKGATLNSDPGLGPVFAEGPVAGTLAPSGIFKSFSFIAKAVLPLIFNFPWKNAWKFNIN